MVGTSGVRCAYPHIPLGRSWFESGLVHSFCSGEGDRETRRGEEEEHPSLGVRLGDVWEWWKERTGLESAQWAG